MWEGEGFDVGDGGGSPTPSSPGKGGGGVVVVGPPPDLKVYRSRASLRTSQLPHFVKEAGMSQTALTRSVCFPTEAVNKLK